MCCVHTLILCKLKISRGSHGRSVCTGTFCFKAVWVARLSCCVAVLRSIVSVPVSVVLQCALWDCGETLTTRKGRGRPGTWRRFSYKDRAPVTGWGLWSTLVWKREQEQTAWLILQYLSSIDSLSGALSVVILLLPADSTVVLVQSRYQNSLINWFIHVIKYHVTLKCLHWKTLTVNEHGSIYSIMQLNMEESRE